MKGLLPSEAADRYHGCRMASQRSALVFLSAVGLRAPKELLARWPEQLVSEIRSRCFGSTRLLLCSPLSFHAGMLLWCGGPQAEGSW